MMNICWIFKVKSAKYCNSYIGFLAYSSLLTTSGFRLKFLSTKISTKFKVENELLLKKGHMIFFQP